MKTTVRIGTRGSQLALYQAELVRAKINQNLPLVSVEIVRIKTTGDMVRRTRFSPFETKRIFTREIEDALLKKEVDLAVHSAKDLAVLLPEGLKVGAVLERESPRDCLITKDQRKLQDLPAGARVGTSSLRRKIQLLRLNPAIHVEDVRGNVDTRIRKVKEGGLDGLVLAYAGLKRLGLTNHVSEIFPEEIFYPAPGQGIIVIESRRDDPDMDEILAMIHHEATGRILECERAFLARLEGGCQLPCGISAFMADGFIKADGIVFAVDDMDWAEASYRGPDSRPSEIGQFLAELILEKGGREILEAIRRSMQKSKP